MLRNYPYCNKNKGSISKNLVKVLKDALTHHKMIVRKAIKEMFYGYNRALPSVLSRVWN